VAATCHRGWPWAAQAAAAVVLTGRCGAVAGVGHHHLPLLPQLGHLHPADLDAHLLQPGAHPSAAGLACPSSPPWAGRAALLGAGSRRGRALLGAALDLAHAAAARAAGPRAAAALGAAECAPSCGAPPGWPLALAARRAPADPTSGPLTMQPSPIQVLGLDIMKSGFLSVLPWVTMALAANVGGWIADSLVSRGISVTVVRVGAGLGQGQGQGQGARCAAACVVPSPPLPSARALWRHQLPRLRCAQASAPLPQPAAERSSCAVASASSSMPLSPRPPPTPLSCRCAR
jgi:hypothetical protein